MLIWSGLIRLGFLGIGVIGSMLGEGITPVSVGLTRLGRLVTGDGWTFWLAFFGVWGFCPLGSSISGGLNGMGELGGLTIGGRSGEGINIGRLETDSLPELAPLLGLAVTVSPGCAAGVLLGITFAGGLVVRRVVLSI